MAAIQFTFKNGSVSSKNAESIVDKLKQDNRYLIDVSLVKRVSSSFYDVLLDYSDNIVVIDRVNRQSQKRLWDLLNEKHKDIEDFKEQWDKVYNNTNKQLRPYSRKIPSKFEVWYKNSMKDLGNIVYDSRIEPKDFKIFKEFENGFDSWQESVRKWHDENHPEHEHFMLLFGIKEYAGPMLRGGGMYTERAIQGINKTYNFGEVPYQLFYLKPDGSHEEIDLTPPDQFKWTKLMIKHKSNIWGGRVAIARYIIGREKVYNSYDTLPRSELVVTNRTPKVRAWAYKRFNRFGIDEEDLFTCTKDNLEETIEKLKQKPGQGLAEFLVQIKGKAYFLLHTIMAKERFEQIKKKDIPQFKSRNFHLLDDLKK